MNEITQFHGILPPGSGSLSTGALIPPAVSLSRSTTTPDGLILRTLGPFREAIDEALVRGDRDGALQLAYTALSRVADDLAAWRGDKPRLAEVRVHALLVELEPLPLEPLSDGTLTERGTAVTVSYRNWAVDQYVATAWTRTLTEQFQALWPGAWVVVGLA